LDVHTVDDLPILQRQVVGQLVAQYIQIAEQGLNWGAQFMGQIGQRLEPDTQFPISGRGLTPRLVRRDLVELTVIGMLRQCPFPIAGSIARALLVLRAMNQSAATLEDRSKGLNRINA